MSHCCQVMCVLLSKLYLNRKLLAEYVEYQHNRNKPKIRFAVYIKPYTCVLLSHANHCMYVAYNIVKTNITITLDVVV